MHHFTIWTDYGWSSSVWVLIPLFFITMIIHFLPTGVAILRKHNNTLAIFVLNLLLGWTFLGWVWAFVWSCTSNTQAKTKRSPKEK